MTEQLDLTGNARTIVDGVTLTSRQQLAYDYVREHADTGTDPDEVGALWHHHQGKHGVDERCTWCGETGTDILRSRTLRKLVTRRRADGRYYPRDRRAAVAADKGEIPW